MEKTSISSDISKGKIKSLFCKMESKVRSMINDHLKHVNLQLKDIHSTLDKKFGGMYKILIHEFLTKQEEKIYNVELLSQATRNILAESTFKALNNLNISKEDFMIEFNKNFNDEMTKINDQVKNKLKEDSNAGENIKKESEDS